MTTLSNLLFRTRSEYRFHRTDALMYLYLTLGTFLMFGPVLWGLVSSFKTAADLERFPPRFLPYEDVKVEVEGYDRPLSVYKVTLDDGTVITWDAYQRLGGGR